MKKFIPLFVLIGVALIAFAVYVAINRLGMATVSAQPAGFFLGLWQGIIVIITFIVSWFDSNITIYQAGNDGFWFKSRLYSRIINRPRRWRQSLNTKEKGQKAEMIRME